MAYSTENKGYLLLINNLLNENSTDIATILGTFRDHLNFASINYQENISNDQIADLFKQIARDNTQESKKYDFSCFICIILARRKNFIETSDDDDYSYDDDDDDDDKIDFQYIIDQFHINDGFKNNPKLIFLHTCVNDREDSDLLIPLALKEDFFF